MKTTILIGIVLAVAIVAGIAVYITIVQPSGGATTTTTSPSETGTGGTSGTSSKPTSETTSKPPASGTGGTETSGGQTSSPPSTSEETRINPTRIRNYKDLVGSFEHAKIEIKQTKNGVTNTSWLVYTLYPDETKVIADKEAMKLVLSFSSDGSEESVTMWITRDLNRILELDMNGQTMTGSMADSLGKQVLNSIVTPAILGYSTWDFGIVIAENSAEALANGWAVTSCTPETITISGQSYNGWDIIVENVGSPSDAKSIHAKAAELKPNTWYAVYLDMVLKDGREIEIAITELVPTT